jgi:hypothetical protein
MRSSGHFHLLRLANCAFKTPSSRSLAARRDKIFEIGLVEPYAGSIDRSYFLLLLQICIYWRLKRDHSHQVLWISRGCQRGPNKERIR